MSLWIGAVICVLLLQGAQPQAQQANPENSPVAIDEVAVPVGELPRRLDTKKDWNINQAYGDVFQILSNQNACSDFYRGPRTAITVLNGFVTRVTSHPLIRDVSFEMAGSPVTIHDPALGTYRLFEKTMVNTNGAFYLRRGDPMRRFPSDVGNFAPGSRAARALILLHELGHLIEGEDGEWLLPDDGYDFKLSKANTSRIQQMCRQELNALK